jgi:hypothetical protein
VTFTRIAIRKDTSSATVPRRPVRRVRATDANGAGTIDGATGGLKLAPIFDVSTPRVRIPAALLCPWGQLREYRANYQANESQVGSSAQPLPHERVDRRHVAGAIDTSLSTVQEARSCVTACRRGAIWVELRRLWRAWSAPLMAPSTAERSGSAGRFW